jgi:hypothetical protein
LATQRGKRGGCSLSDDDNFRLNSGAADRLDPNRKISEKAMRRLDDDVIAKMLLRPDRERRERSWWRRLLR